MQNKDYTPFPPPDSDPTFPEQGDKTIYVDFEQINKMAATPSIRKLQRFQDKLIERPAIKEVESAIVFPEKIKEPKKHRFSLRNHEPKEEGFRHRLSVRLGLKKERE